MRPRLILLAVDPLGGGGLTVYKMLLFSFIARVSTQLPLLKKSSSCVLSAANVKTEI